MTADEAREILRDVHFYDRPQWEWEIREHGTAAAIHGDETADFSLMARFRAPDGSQTTRKWRLSTYMTRSEVVQTALKCALTSAEHQVREHFLYRGRRVFGPHFDVDQLWTVAAGPLDKRVDA